MAVAADGRRQGATARVPVSFPAVQGRDLTITVTGVRLETTKDYSSQAPISLPVGIAELGVPATLVGTAPSAFSGACRSNLLTLDGKPVSVALTGPTQGALAGNGLTLSLCGADARGITMAAGTHVVLGAPGAGFAHPARLKRTPVFTKLDRRFV